MKTCNHIEVIDALDLLESRLRFVVVALRDGDGLDQEAAAGAALLLDDAFAIAAAAITTAIAPPLMALQSDEERRASNGCGPAGMAGKARSSRPSSYVWDIPLEPSASDPHLRTYWGSMLPGERASFVRALEAVAGRASNDRPGIAGELRERRAAMIRNSDPVPLLRFAIWMREALRVEDEVEVAP